MLNMKSVIMGAAILLLAASCNTQTQNQPASTSENNKSISECNTQKSIMTDYLKAMDVKTKQQVGADLVTSTSSIKEVFYSPKNKGCVYVAQTDKTWKSQSPNYNLTLRDGTTGAVLVSAIIFPDRSDKQTNIDEFNTQVKSYK